MIFSQKNSALSSQQHQLLALLNQYKENGVPQVESAIVDRQNLPPSLRYLFHHHTHFRDVTNQQQPNKHEDELQEAIWELVTSEIEYIQSLRTINYVSDTIIAAAGIVHTLFDTTCR